MRFSGRVTTFTIKLQSITECITIIWHQKSVIRGICISCKMSLSWIKWTVVNFQILLILLCFSVLLFPPVNIFQLALMSACKIFWVLCSFQRMPHVQQLQYTTTDLSSPATWHLLNSCIWTQQQHGKPVMPRKVFVTGNHWYSGNDQY